MTSFTLFYRSKKRLEERGLGVESDWWAFHKRDALQQSFAVDPSVLQNIGCRKRGEKKKNLKKELLCPNSPREL